MQWQKPDRSSEPPVQFPDDRIPTSGRTLHNRLPASENRGHTLQERRAYDGLSYSRPFLSTVYRSKNPAANQVQRQKSNLACTGSASSLDVARSENACRGAYLSFGCLKCCTAPHSRSTRASETRSGTRNGQKIPVHPGRARGGFRKHRIAWFQETSFHDTRCPEIGRENNRRPDRPTLVAVASPESGRKLAHFRNRTIGKTPVRPGPTQVFYKRRFPLRNILEARLEQLTLALPDLREVRDQVVLSYWRRLAYRPVG